MNKPVISPLARIAEHAVICGNVELKSGSNIWFHTTIRAEMERITIGTDSNVQDNCVIHVDEGCPVTVGDRVTVGHGCILHGCTIGDESLIGMGSTVLNGAHIGRGCILGAGSLVTQNTVIPDGMMAFGRPAKVVRPVTPEERADLLRNAEAYVAESKVYVEEGLFREGTKG